MPRALLLVRYFPPSGGSGVQRLARLARYLPAIGFTVDVLTTDLLAEGATQDPALAAELPPEVTVLRRTVRASRAMRSTVRALRLGFAFYRTLRLLGVPDPDLVDLPEMLWTAARQPRPDVVLASSPPFSNLITGLAIATHFGVPWVADLRDPWSFHPWFRPASALHLRAMHRLESAVLGRAARVLVVSEEMRAFIPESLGPRVEVLPNGFDPADFSRLVRAVPPWSAQRAAPRAAFRLSFIGTLQRGIRLEAFARLPPGFELEVVGRALVPPPPGAHVRGYVSHHEALAAMADADALILDLPEEMAFAPASKLYEYLIAGPPVLAVVPPQGAAARLVRDTRGGVVVAPGDAAGLERALLALRAGTVELSSVSERRDLLRAFRRDEQAAELARILHDAINRTGTAPSAP